MTEVRAFQPADLAAVADRASALALVAPDPATAGAVGAAGPAYTLWRDGRPVACGGVAMPWAGLGEAWLVVTPDAPIRPLYRATLNGIAAAFRHNGLRRLQATVRADHDAAKRLADHLGFAVEAHLWQYGPGGEDMLLYVRYR